MAAIAAAGVGMMMICCSSSMASLAMGGEDDTKKDAGAGAGAGAGAKTPAAAYTESCDDLDGGVNVRFNSDVDLDSCKQKCTDDLDCLGFVHGEATGFCQLHDNKEPIGVDVCDRGFKMYRDTTGKTATYSQSCDDIGGNVIERIESGEDLNSCKTKCNADTSCKGIVHTEATGFCQLHDNNDPLGVDVCSKGFKIFRK